MSLWRFAAIFTREFFRTCPPSGMDTIRASTCTGGHCTESELICSGPGVELNRHGKAGHLKTEAASWGL